MPRDKRCESNVPGPTKHLLRGYDHHGQRLSFVPPSSVILEHLSRACIHASDVEYHLFGISIAYQRQYGVPPALWLDRTRYVWMYGLECTKI